MITTLNNMNVAITGGLKKMTRAKAFNLILADGGNPQKKITKSTDVLVIADDKVNQHTIKTDKADKWFIDTISESDFYFIVKA